LVIDYTNRIKEREEGGHLCKRLHASFSEASNDDLKFSEVVEGQMCSG
jgi:hypothetical protein